MTATAPALVEESHVRSTAPAALLLDVLSSASSVTEAARAAGMKPSAFRSRCVRSASAEVKAAYAACAARGIAHGSSAKPAPLPGYRWAVTWRRVVNGVTWNDRIWTLHTETPDRDKALVRAAEVTRREATALTVELEGP